MKSIQAIIFDLEGTIIDTEPVWDDTAVEFLKRHNRAYDRHATKHLLMGGTIEAGARIMRDQYGFEGDPAVLAQERRDIFEELLAREVTFIPGFEVFHAQVSPHYKLAIGTSMEHRFLRDVEKRLHLSKFFGPHIYSIEDIGFIPKPQPDIFLHAARKLGVDPANCLVIEDAPHGVAAAKAAGMHAVALTTSTTANRLTEADQIVNHYSEINLNQA